MTMPRKRRGRRAARKQVSREAKDILLKRQAAALPDTFLAMLGLDLPSFVTVLPNELPVLAVSAELPDLLLRLVDDAIVDLEFQLTTTGDDLHRFYRYHYAISETLTQGSSPW